MIKKKFVAYFYLLFLFLFYSCVDYEVSETEKPSRLGGSVYSVLSNPSESGLTGTFSYYLRLIDDLGYAETLNKTGSVTVFPANDEAFGRFFNDNIWKVKSYDDLTINQKQLLFYNSMLDNAILTGMLSNVSASSTSVNKGVATKHETSASAISDIRHWEKGEMPANNTAWDKYRNLGSIDLVCDATRPMMVHFTREHMLNNNITTDGEESDFTFITGSTYEEGTAFIFRDKIITPNVICMNGYVHQMEEVIVPPGNMAQVIRENSTSSLFNRMLDRFAVPYLNSEVTQSYNDWAVQNSQPEIQNIYELRYLSKNSQDGTLNYYSEPGVDDVSSNVLLRFDPGWNQYPETSDLTDIGAMFVPTDDAMWQFFGPNGEGAYIIDAFGTLENTRENLAVNTDSIPQYIVATFLNNMMQISFIDAVPSKFSTIMNTAAELLGMDKKYVHQENGVYDVKIANNGVIYMLDEVFVPDEYKAVSAPTLFNDNLSVMRWAIDDRTIYNGDDATASVLGLDFWAYLLAMSANFAFFIPTDAAFDAYVLDPVSLLDDTQTPTGLHYYTIEESPFIACKRVSYDTSTNTFGSEYPDPISDFSTVSTQLADILNTHTIVLKTGEVLGDNHYYKTKQGAAIYLNDASEGGYVSAGGQGSEGLPLSKIINIDIEKNGRAYQLDHVLQTPTQSIYSILKSDDRFSDFVEMCEGFEAEELLDWLEISNTVIAPATKSAQENLKIFSKAFQSFDNGNKKQVSLDMNLTLFNSYNYTVYAPNNNAMDIAYNNGLPHWQEIQELYDAYAYHGNVKEQEAKEQALAMIDAMHEFVCYHLQNDYVFADNTISSGSYQTMLMDDQNIFYKLTVSGGNGYIYVTDQGGLTHTISASSNLKTNLLARDYLFAYETEDSPTPYISTSSFAVIHELDTPLCLYSDQRFDHNMENSTTKQTAIKRLKNIIKR